MLFDIIWIYTKWIIKVISGILQFNSNKIEQFCRDQKIGKVISTDHVGTPYESIKSSMNIPKYFSYGSF